MIPLSYYCLSTLKLMHPLADLLAVLNAPERPAAALLLTRGLIALGGAAGLKSANQPVRQVRAENQLQSKGAVLSLCDMRVLRGCSGHSLSCCRKTKQTSCSHLQLCVDLLGGLAAALCADKDAAIEDANWLRDTVAHAGDDVIVPRFSRACAEPM